MQQCKHAGLFFVLISVAAIYACSDDKTMLESAKDTIVGTGKGAFEAVQSPLEDLNFKRQKIPPKLKAVSGNPYAMPTPPMCSSIRSELKDFDTLLGPDMEPPPLPWLTHPKDKTDMRPYVNEGVESAQQQAVGIVRSKVDIIPFRGMVRRVSGADKYAKGVQHAYDAGKLRRAFLKGLSSAYACDLKTIAPAEDVDAIPLESPR